MRYFENRSIAGKLLASQLANYKTKNCAVICLSEGGVVVGAEVAKQLHSSLFKLSTENISLPGDPRPVAAISSSGELTYNSEYSQIELEEVKEDYRGWIEQNRLLASQKMHSVGKDEGTVSKKLLANHVVILVSDGFNSALSLEAAIDFLKPIKIERLIVAAPIASVAAIDRIHFSADEIHCLEAVEDYVDTDHYYENNQLPEQKEIAEMMERVALDWENPSPPASA